MNDNAEVATEALKALDVEIPLDTPHTHPLATRPRRIAILGLGPSIKDYLSETARKRNLCHIDEIWGINTSHRAFNCDKIWIMDDLMNMSRNYPDWANELRLENTPIITCRHYDEFPTSVEYPLEAVCKDFKDDYFSTTVAYMIAYAAHIRVEEMLLFGIDFHYPNAVIVESGSAGVAYWLGRATERGVHYKIPGSSTLLDANMIELDESTNPPKAKRLLYGYDYNPQDADRRVKQGTANENEQIAAQRSYRPTDTSDPAVMEKLGKQLGQPVEVEPK